MRLLPPSINTYWVWIEVPGLEFSGLHTGSCDYSMPITTPREIPKSPICFNDGYLGLELSRAGGKNGSDVNQGWYDPIREYTHEEDQ
jgi:hypothetical protein